MTTVNELEAQLAELRAARLAAIKDSLDDPSSASLASKIKAEIAKLESDLEDALLVEKAVAERDEGARLVDEAALAEERRLQVNRIASEALEAASRADAALIALMDCIDEIQDGARQILKIDTSNKSGVVKLFDAAKVGRAVLGRRLNNGRLVADYFGARRPIGFRADETIEDFVAKFL